MPTQRPLDHSGLDMASQAEGGHWKGSVCYIPCGGIPTVVDWTQIPGSPGNISLHSGGLNPMDCDDPFAASRSLNKFSSPALWKLLTMLGSRSISDIEVHPGGLRSAFDTCVARWEAVHSCCSGLQWRLASLREGARPWPQLSSVNLPPEVSPDLFSF